MKQMLALFILIFLSHYAFAVNPVNSLLIISKQKETIDLHLKMYNEDDSSIKSQSLAIVAGGIGLFSVAYFTQENQLGTQSEYIKYIGEGLGVGLFTLGAAAYVFNF